MDRRNPGARNPPRARARGGPRPQKRRGGGRRKWILGSAGLWRPRGSLAPASSDGALPAASTTALRDLCGAAPCGAAFGVPLAPYGRARLVVAGGPDVFGPFPSGASRRLSGRSPAVEAAARVGRHRAPAAGPPPLRLHDPVRTRLLAGGERRQRTTAGNRCQGLFSRKLRPPLGEAPRPFSGFSASHP